MQVFLSLLMIFVSPISDRDRFILSLAGTHTSIYSWHRTVFFYLWNSSIVVAGLFGELCLDMQALFKKLLFNLL